MIPIRSTFHSIVVSSAILVLTGACSSVPDAASPAHWYRSTVDYFSGDEKDKAKDQARGRRAAPKPASATAESVAEPAPAAAEDKTAPATANSDIKEMSDRLGRPSQRGLLADSGGPRPRYAPAVPRQADDSGVPPSRARTAYSESPSAAAPPAPTSAPRAPVSATPAAPAAAEPPVRKAEPPAAQPPAAQPPTAQPRVARPPVVAPQVAEVRRPPTPASSPVSRPAPSAPSDSARTAVADSKPISVEEAYRASLARQNQLPTTAEEGLADDPGTMIISSEGIERARRAPSAMETAAAPATSARAAPAKDRPDLSRFLDTTSGAGTGGKLVRIATIQFPDGSAKLDSEARAVLAQVAKLQREKSGTVRVVGHASLRTRPMDADRHSRVNEGISIARANAVAQQLTRIGVKRSAIAVSGLGASDPVYFEVMETGEAGNRRAEIYMEF